MRRSGTQETLQFDYWLISYALDANGNRTGKTAGGVTTYYGHDAQNKLLWTNQGTNAAPTAGQASPYRRYTYDPLGQPTQIERRDSTGGAVASDRYDWDGMGKLRRVRDTPAGLDRYTAAYDGGGTRVSSVLGGVPHTYSYGMGLLHDDAGSTTYTPGVSQRKNGVDHTFHEDWRTSTRYLMDATGNMAPTAYRYDAYGNTTASGGPDQTSFKFAGGVGYESDAPNGLQLLGARYYDPAVGRFLNPDPISYAGGLNLYAYCENDPVNAVDPSGLVSKLVAVALAAAATYIGKSASEEHYDLLDPQSDMLVNGRPYLPQSNTINLHLAYMKSRGMGVLAARVRVVGTKDLRSIEANAITRDIGWGATSRPIIILDKGFFRRSRDEQLNTLVHESLHALCGAGRTNSEASENAASEWASYFVHEADERVNPRGVTIPPNLANLVVRGVGPSDAGYGFTRPPRRRRKSR
ncbi:MAG TPA: RHS repeat-associated core domain-containing protein [Armatimonadota bacterium]|nr:RHS repeat-associated core domain-containing protein [Armatimonadota bacterium]